MPKRPFIRQGADHSSIPSKKSMGTSSDTCRNTAMEKVARGQITGAAATEIRRKAKCLAPAYNKGAYQYISDENAAKDAGHKGAGEGER